MLEGLFRMANSAVHSDRADAGEKPIATTTSAGEEVVEYSTIMDDSMRSPEAPSRTRTALEVQKDERRVSKIVMRVVFGSCMFLVFCSLVYAGHIYICGLVAAIELLLFRELVRVRYSWYYKQIQNTIPLFRTTQWLWFAVAISYTYGDFISEIIQSNTSLHYLLQYTQYFPTVSFLLYSCTFVLTIVTLQRDSIKFQINQLCWTILVLCLTVGQLKYIMHNIFNGLIWFVLPCCLVFTNDIMAYASGVTCGRKFIHRQFISFSPNKTWEGFIGGFLFTMIAAWHLSRFLAQWTWMTCPTNEFRLDTFSKPLSCELDPIFSPAQSFVPSQIFELIPIRLVKVIFPRIVEICVIRNVGTTTHSMTSQDEIVLTPCISGELNHQHHHFELSIRNYYPIQMHALWLGLFASLVAPFGGFLASAIKRAYGIKDFDSLIPGHGGVMDRMDCQFLMALCTWVHYNTFVKFRSISVPKLTYMYSLLSDQQKAEFLRIITSQFTDGGDNVASSLAQVHHEEL
jgi:phosphatidate cytidylyltransferase